MQTVLKEFVMLEVELSLVFFSLGIVFDRVIFPRFILPKLKERLLPKQKHPGGRPKKVKA